MAIDYEIQEGECIGSIAFANGFTWQTLWNHPNNAALKAKRNDPNLLNPGDVVHIPDLRVEEQSCAVDQRHSFRRKAVPAKLRIQLLQQKKKEDKTSASPSTDLSHYEDPDFQPHTQSDEPRANVPYVLEIDGTLIQGKSDGKGFIDVPLSPGASGGRMVLNPGTPAEETYPLQLGGMDPISELGGVKKRLRNLGFPAGDGVDETPELEAALCLFQEKFGLPITGKLEASTRAKLKSVHGG